jgi:hypothetical protein
MARDASIESLDESACVELLETHHFGRLGFLMGGDPMILPVNYVYSDGRVAIRTDPGTKLAAVALARVAFEIDEIDEGGRRGWSVLVQGTGYDITDSIDPESESIRAFPVDAWAPGPKANWIRVEPRTITGRRVRPA